MWLKVNGYKLIGMQDSRVGWCKVGQIYDPDVVVVGICVLLGESIVGSRPGDIFVTELAIGYKRPITRVIIIRIVRGYITSL